MCQHNKAPLKTLSKLSKLCLWVLLLLTGCTTQPLLHMQDKALLQQRQNSLKTVMHDWSLQGKAGIRTEQAFNTAYINWRYTPQLYWLDLTGPFGRGHLQLTGNAKSVTLHTEQGSFSAKSAQHLLLEQTGIDLPVSNLIWWIRALPAPGTRLQAFYLHETGEPAQIEQDGWSIHYDRYQPVHDFNGIALPHRIKLTTTGLQVTLIISKWEQ